MEDDDWWVVLIHIVGGAEAEVLVGFLRELRVQQYILGAVFSHRHVVATIHSCEVNGARPVASGVDGAAFVREVAQRAFQIDINCAYLCLLDAARSGCCRGEMTAR